MKILLAALSQNDNKMKIILEQTKQTFQYNNNNNNNNNSNNSSNSMDNDDDMDANMELFAGVSLGSMSNFDFVNSPKNNNNNNNMDTDDDDDIKISKKGSTRIYGENSIVLVPVNSLDSLNVMQNENNINNNINNNNDSNAIKPPYKKRKLRSIYSLPYLQPPTLFGMNDNIMGIPNMFEFSPHMELNRIDKSISPIDTINNNNFINRFNNTNANDTFKVPKVPE